MPVPWSIRLARALFLTLAVLLGAMIAVGFKHPVWQGTLCGLGAGLFFILVDSLLALFSFRDFSFATFGLLIGLFCAWLVTKIGIFDLPWFQSLEDADAIRSVVEMCIYAVFGFLGITLALRSDRDQFSFIIPYVRFRRDASEGEPMLLDANVIIDGRIPRVFATGFLTGNFIVPRFVIEELQNLADSQDPIDAERGRQGLDCLKVMRETSGIEVSVHDHLLHETGPVDARLVSLARSVNARLLTNDVNLGKVATVRSVPVLNFHDLAKALQAEVRVGDTFELSLVKPGKDKHQAVGFLPTGAMIVVNHASHLMGETVAVRVGGMLQTSAGKLIFAELDTRLTDSPAP